jgi:hypothetical protein
MIRSVFIVAFLCTLSGCGQTPIEEMSESQASEKEQEIAEEAKAMERDAAQSVQDLEKKLSEVVKAESEAEAEVAE